MMSKNASLFNKASGSRYMTRKPDCCPTCPPYTPASPCHCNPAPNENCKDICVNPPVGQPKSLTLLAPVVFDECGLNLCKVVQRNVFCNPEIASIRLRVIDIDFNMGRGDHSSHIETLRSRPSCSRITLSGIRVKLAVTVLDRCQNVLDTFIMVEEYLPACQDDPCYDEEANPCSLCMELYTPYGLSYLSQDPPCPTINYFGMEEMGACGMGNNSLRQGVGAQALAKVVRFDPEDGVVAIGLTIYLKSIYFVQYRVPHEGLAVPPKCDAIVDQCDACKDFVEGDLLSLNLKPLDFC
jgi:hypothetical protein